MVEQELRCTTTKLKPRAGPTRAWIDELHAIISQQLLTEFIKLTPPSLDAVFALYPDQKQAFTVFEAAICHRRPPVFHRLALNEND
eukprot:7070533-Prymnesium_polylepis.2